MQSKSAASLVLLVLSVMLSTLLVACGDGQPAFCSQLSKSADLSGIASALRSSDLSKASDEAAKKAKVATVVNPTKDQKEQHYGPGGDKGKNGGRGN